MAARPRWKGTLSLGLVSVPVHLYATADKKSQAPVGHNVHRACQTQANTKKWCAKCDKEIPEDELMRGYDAPGGKFVELTEDEIGSLKVESTKTIVIKRVADAAELEPLMIADTMYLLSDGTAAAAEAEAVLVEALVDKVAVGTLTLSGRERPVALMVYRGGFVLHVLRTADAMKELPQRVPLPPANPQMVELARQLAGAMEGPLDLHETRDGYADGMKALVQAKFDGEPIDVAPVQTSAKVMSLMDALKASMTVVQPSRTAEKPKAAKAEAPAKKARKSA